jgi:hypothetical protein
MHTLSRQIGFTEEFFVDLVKAGESGWEVCLPSSLRKHQGELEDLLRRVFGDRPASNENLALAQQLAMNWCFSKRRQNEHNEEKMT